MRNTRTVNRLHHYMDEYDTDHIRVHPSTRGAVYVLLKSSDCRCFPPSYTCTWPHLRRDVGLKEGSYHQNCLRATVLCTVIMVRSGTSSSWSTGSGFDLAWFSYYLPSTVLRVGTKISVIYIIDIYRDSIMIFSIFSMFSKYQPILLLFTCFSNSRKSNTNCPSP